MEKIKRVKKNKKGVSAIIGYVLLVSFAVILGISVYGVLKTYVPTEKLECPDETSLFILEKDCEIDEGEQKLKLTFKNNGRFNIDGFFIYGSNSSGSVPTEDLSDYNTGNSGSAGNKIMFNIGYTNSLIPGEDAETRFSIPLSKIDGLKKISITPTRDQKQDGVIKSVSCGNARIIEDIGCA